MASEATTERMCAGCKHLLTFVGIRDVPHFRTGGHDGVGTALLGALAGASKDLLRVALSGCASCGRLEMYLPPARA